MPRVQDVAEVGLHVRADQRGAVHHLGDVLQPGGDLDVVDRRCRWPGRCSGSSRPAARPRTAGSAFGSKVSGAAMPPAIHSRMQASAFARGMLDGRLPFSGSERTEGLRRPGRPGLQPMRVLEELAAVELRRPVMGDGHGMHVLVKWTGSFRCSKWPCVIPGETRTPPPTLCGWKRRLMANLSGRSRFTSPSAHPPRCGG